MQRLTPARLAMLMPAHLLLLATIALPSLYVFGLIAGALRWWGIRM